MMTQKAILFEDTETAKEVLAIKGSKHTDCSKVKAMGRKVKSFDDKVWVRERGKFQRVFVSKNVGIVDEDV
jgi:predicted NAD-dependent protein-ADP-ribosyltransferase YbiA (DUF1768 family)